jgi:putative transposase
MPQSHFREKKRFPGEIRVPQRLQWLSDNGPAYTAHASRATARLLNMIPCNSPAYSPESNGMAEAFVKTFRRDYIHLGEVSCAEAVLKQLPTWFGDYNEFAPHRGLGGRSPREFLRAVS